MIVMVRKKTPLAKRLIALREKLDITQEQAAQLIGASVSTWVAWENGARKPTFATEHLIRMMETGEISPPKK